MNDAALNAFREYASAMGIDPFPAGGLTEYTIHYPAAGGSWGVAKIVAGSIADALARIRSSELCDRANGKMAYCLSMRTLAA